MKVKSVHNKQKGGWKRQIEIGNLKDDRVRREYQAVIAELYAEAIELEGVYQEQM